SRSPSTRPSPSTATPTPSTASNREPRWARSSWSTDRTRLLPPDPPGSTTTVGEPDPGGSMADLEALKDRIDSIVEEWAPALVDASRRIHGNPELGFEERYAHDAPTELLESAGLEVTRGAYGLPTAFE